MSLKPSTLLRCVRRVLRTNLPVLVLGGGGYDELAAARFFTRLVALCCDMKLADNIPDECEHFEEFKSTAFRLREDEFDLSDVDEDSLEDDESSDQREENVEELHPSKDNLKVESNDQQTNDETKDE